MSEQDANKILKNRYGEVPESTRKELAADDLQTRLAEACESVGVAAGTGTWSRRVSRFRWEEGTLPFPELLAGLEAWLLKQGCHKEQYRGAGFRTVIWTDAQHREIAKSINPKEDTDSVDAKAALAAAGKVEK